MIDWDYERSRCLFPSANKDTSPDRAPHQEPLERLERIAHSVWARGHEGTADSIRCCIHELRLRQGCRCVCCDHGESSDCACDCHANGACAYQAVAALGDLRSRLRQEVLEAIPTSWLDSLLTGPNAVLPSGGRFDCGDIERLLSAVKDRLAALVAEQEAK
jgi:hypothetical protein